MILRTTFGVVLAGLVLGTLGCGGAKVEDTVLVKFKVTQNGQPVSGPASDPFEAMDGPPQAPQGELFMLTFAKVDGDQQIGYGQKVVLQGGVVEHRLPLGKFQVQVTKQKSMEAMGGEPTEAAGGEGAAGGGQPLATKEIEVTQDGQEFTIDISGGGG